MKENKYFLTHTFSNIKKKAMQLFRCVTTLLVTHSYTLFFFIALRMPVWGDLKKSGPTIILAGLKKHKKMAVVGPQPSSILMSIPSKTTNYF